MLELVGLALDPGEGLAQDEGESFLVGLQEGYF